MRYDELKYAEYIEKNGFLTKYQTYELKILAKYYKIEKNKSITEIKSLLQEFCKKNIIGFDMLTYFRKINNIVNYVNNKDVKLIVINEIVITEAEFDYINGLDIDYIYKKIVFTLLVKNKINKAITSLIYNKESEFNYFGGTKNHYKEILDMSNIKKTKLRINQIIHELHVKNIIEVKTRGRIDLKFINNIKSGTKDKITIKEFTNIGYCFDFNNGDKSIIKCENCGKYIKKTSNRIKYCNDCWKKKEKESKLKWWNNNTTRCLENSQN